jgi:hypothetical protein
MKTAGSTLATLLALVLLAGVRAHAVPVGEACGAETGAVCDRGLWCEPPIGTCVATTGVCVAVPRFCIAHKKSRSYRPVCGCNNKTYSSDCFRRAYKVAKLRDGKCEVAGPGRSRTR